MNRALLIKELRELAPWAGLTVIIFALCLIDLAGTNPFTLQRTAQRPIPFLGESLPMRIGAVGGLSAIVFAFRQTFMESVLGTWLLLLHRPMPRRRIIELKLLAGSGVLLAVTLIPLLGYTIWAATPGTHASPFRWDFTLRAWAAWLGLTVIYLGAFLSGLRDARWWGSRLFPLVFAALSYMIITLECNHTGFFWPCVLMLILDAVLLAAIFDVTATQDFS